MSNIPKDLKYNRSHEWVREDEGNVVIVGITDHAQSLLGDLVYVELPEVGKEFDIGEECCVVESVKAASDVYAPVAGTVLEVNEDLHNSPEKVNDDPYEDGWLFKLKVDNIDDLDDLVDADEYEMIITEDA